eukprot:1893649-Amphidinium_carterae.1
MAFPGVLLRRTLERWFPRAPTASSAAPRLTCKRSIDVFPLILSRPLSLHMGAPGGVALPE